MADFFIPPDGAGVAAFSRSGVRSGPFLADFRLFSHFPALLGEIPLTQRPPGVYFQIGLYMEKAGAPRPPGRERAGRRPVQREREGLPV